MSISRSALRPVLLLAVLAAVTCAVYSPVLRFDFVNWDDDLYVKDNTSIRSLSADHAWKWLTKPVVKIYAPVVMMSYAADYKLGGLDPETYHRTNFLLHTANVLALFLLLRMMAGERAAFFAAIIFALHPAQAQTVAWISERKNLLGGLFAILSFTFYVRYANGAKKSQPLFAAVAFFFVLSLLSRPSAVMLPFLFWAYDYFFAPRREAVNTRNALLVMTSVAIACGTCLLYPQSAVTDPESHAGIWPLTQAKNLAVYFMNLMAPLNLRVLYLDVPYPLNSVGGIIGIVGLLLGLAACLWAIVRRTPQGFYLSWIFLFLLPVSTFFYVPVGDQHLYMPMMGFGAFVGTLAARYKKAGAFCLAAAVFCAMPITLKQLSLWRNSESLWTSEIRKGSKDYRVLVHLANYLESREENEKAIELYRQAIRLKGPYPAYVNLASLLMKTKDFAAAHRMADRLEEMKGGYTESLVVRAQLADLEGKEQEALEYLNLAISKEPDHVGARVKRGVLWLRRHKPEAAIEDFQEVLLRKPDFPDARYHLGLAYLQASDWKRALRQFEGLLKDGEPVRGIYFQMGYAAFKQGDLRLARGYYGKSMRMQPEVAEAYFHMGLLVFQSKRTVEACAYFQKALSLQPDTAVFKSMADKCQENNA